MSLSTPPSFPRYALCLEAAPDLKRVCPSAEDWRWAHTNARARLAQCGDIRAEAIAEGEGEIALHLAVLAPYFDLCNHAAIPSLSWWWDPVRDVLVLSAKAALPRGSPLTIGSVRQAPVRRRRCRRKQRPRSPA